MNLLDDLADLNLVQRLLGIIGLIVLAVMLILFVWFWEWLVSSMGLSRGPYA